MPKSLHRKQVDEIERALENAIRKTMEHVDAERSADLDSRTWHMMAKAAAATYEAAIANAQRKGAD